LKIMLEDPECPFGHGYCLAQTLLDISLAHLESIPLPLRMSTKQDASVSRPTSKGSDISPVEGSISKTNISEEMTSLQKRELETLEDEDQPVQKQAKIAL